MRNFLVAVVAFLCALGAGEAMAASSLTLRVVGEGGMGIPSGEFPYLSAELYMYTDGSAEPRWISSSAYCVNGEEGQVKRLCASSDGQLHVDLDWNGNPIGEGAYLIWLQASNYEGVWYQFEVLEGENLKDAVVLKSKSVSVFPGAVRISAEGDMEVGLTLVVNTFRPIKAEVYVVAEGPGLTERWMARQLGNGYRPRVYNLTRRRAASYWEYLRINPEVPDGLTYCFTVYVMRPGSLAFGEAIGRANFCRSKGAEEYGYGGGKG